MSTAVFRFMSFGEFEAFQRGERVCSPRYKGSYFLSLFGEWKPSAALEFLDGLVSEDVCAIFMAPTSAFEVRLAPYADPAIGSAWDDTIDVWELFVPGGYARDDGFALVGVLPALDYEHSPEGAAVLRKAEEMLESVNCTTLRRLHRDYRWHRQRILA